MEGQVALAERFEEHRVRLRGLAYRMLGSLSEADDAVQEGWLRLSGADAGAVANLGGWLTVAVARLCLDMLRVRESRREQPLDEAHVPDPIVTAADGSDPERQALVADSVGMARMVVLERLPPAQRVAFVLHDAFAVPFEEIAPVVGRTPEAARQLASRARHRVQEADAQPDADAARQREAVDAFFAAVGEAHFGRLLAVLHPDVVVRADFGPVPPGASRVVRGAEAVAEQAQGFARYAGLARPALVNGAAGVFAAANGQLYSVMGFTVRDGRIVEIDILADPARLREVEVPERG